MTERDIFLAALDLADPVARAAYLDRACDGDPARRERVEALLRSHDAAGSFLATPAVAPPDPDRAATRTFGAPDADTTAAGGSPVPDDEAVGFLAPPGRPGSLGRLGHYEVLEVLGRGGFGIVFRAFDNVLQRVVAVKVLAPHMAATSPARKRFLREARSSAAIRHDNVVQVHEVQEQPLPYLVMEFIPGETLQQRLDRTGPLDVPEVLRIGRQVAEGLAAAHATGLIHRDVKPANVLIDSGPQARVKLTDFGLARAADDASISQSGVVAGTPMYMAPEQARGEPLDHRADLFSLGSVLYVMCSGRPPFRASGTLAVLKRVAEDEPRPIREIIPEVPEWLCRVVEKLHAKNPDGRFQTAREVADVLADCERQLQAHGALRDFSRIPGGPPLPPRHRRLAWAVGSLALLYLLAWGVYALTRPARRVEDVPQTGDPQALDDKARLQGRWRLVALERYGKPVPVTTPQNFHWIEFAGDRQTLHSVGEPPLEAQFALNPAADPRELDFITPQGRIRLIYRFDGDQVVVAQGPPGGPRPMSFASAPDSPVTVGVYVRDAAPTAEAGWVQLFNGKDLSGWKTHPDGPGRWAVEDGVLVGREKTSYLFSDRQFQDFHLRADMRVNAPGDAGVYFRSPFAVTRLSSLPNLPIINGYEAQVAEGGQNRTGDLALRAGPRPWEMLAKAGRPSPGADRWFTLEVIARGDRVEVKVDGVTTATHTDPNNTFRRGHLALQVFTPETVVQFRKVEVKELPAADDTRTDRDRLQGKWRNISGEIRGRPMAVAELKEFDWIIFAGDEQSWNHKDKVFKGTYRLNTATDPKQLDFVFEGSKPNLMIYQFEGDTLVIAEGGPDGPRPTGFRTTPQTRFKVERFRRETESGFVPLFNGADLAGWTPHTRDGSWRVPEPGVLAGTGTGHLVSRGSYENFHLRAEVRIDDGGDSGILFRCDRDSFGGEHPTGFEAMINPTGQQSPRTGSLTDPQANYAYGTDPAVPPGTWFTYEVIAAGDRITLKVNGRTTLDGKHGLRKWAAGPVGLQLPGRGKTVSFRKIEIKELPAGSTPASAPRTVDLLALIDPARDTLQGVWKWDGKALDSPPPVAQLQVPFAPPEHYRMTMEVERTTAPGALNFGLIVAGRTACVTLDYNPPMKGGQRSGLAGLDGKLLRKNEAAFDGPVLGPGRNTVVAEVRGNHIVVRVGPLTVIDWKGAPARFTVSPNMSKTDGKRLYLGHLSAGYRFHRLELTPLPPPTAAAPPDAAKARPNAGAARPDPAVVAPLRDAAAAKQRERDAVKAQFDAARVSRGELITAEVGLTEARVRLAEAEGDRPAVLARLHELVAHRQEERRLTAAQVEAGVAPPTALAQADARLGEATARLATARSADTPAQPAGAGQPKK